MSLTDRIAALTPEQRALFEKLRETKRQAARAHQPPPVQRLSGPDGAGDWPLSLDQERYWFMEQLRPGGAGLNIGTATRMRGPLSVPALAAAFAEILRRHAAWRTTFPVLDGGPVQRVAVSRRQRLAVVDVSGLPEARRETEALRLVGEDAAAPFDLERGPLVRTSLVRVGPRDHVCLLTAHHLVVDFLAFQIVWAELAALYAAFAAGGPPRLPEPPVHYSDFAVWQREWLQGEVLADLISWWRERLAGFPLALDLPTDRPRPAVMRMRGGRRLLSASRELSEALRTFARQEGATLFMTVLATLAALLHRESSQEKLILGANNANRNRPEIQPVVGTFLTQVPFPIDLEGDPTCRELLARVRQSALGAYAHQDLSFGKLVEAIQPQRDTSRQPIIQTLVQVLDGQPQRTDLAGVTFESIDAYDGNARYELLLTLFDQPAGLSGSLEYDADLFDLATVERLCELLLLQASAATADPDLPLSALPVLTPAARHQVLAEWSDTARPLPGWTVPERFAGWAAATPDALAVAAAGEELTFGELDRRADALAQRLRGAGVGPESRVALLLDRTAEMPVALLGVWKAGGACVPLDPASPPERLATLLQDAEPAVIIHRGFELEVSSSRQGGGQEGALPRPEHLAYMIYTSGTTGLPKAVLVEHGSLAAVLDAVAGRFGFAPGDRMPHLARFSFDISLFELFAPLLGGGACEILQQEEVLEPAALLAALERATRFHAVPSLMRQVAASARAAGPERFAGLRTLFTGGDLVPPDLLVELGEVFPSAEVAVLYGPTEGTIVCTSHSVAPGERPERTLIGRPFANAGMRVIDRWGDAPLGVPGELWIGGPGVARGYFRRDELTAERFVERDGRRYYRTGDLVRHLADGTLEFLGRTDLQVKVRGFRVEPGEVEAALLAHPAVREAVVVARGNRLVAYLVAGAAPPVEEIRAFLRTRLPEYMVPGVFVPLAALPLSPNGKVDRKALPAPEPAGEALAGSTPPRDAREERLAAIWREVLGLERVGVHDNFFQLGGDSILSIQVVARARREGLLISPQQLFENQTIAGLAAVAGSAEEPGTAHGRSPSDFPLAGLDQAALDRLLGTNRDLEDLYPLAPMQQGMLFHSLYTAGADLYVEQLTTELSGPLDEPAFTAAWRQVIARHAVLRTGFLWQEVERPLQLVRREVELPWMAEDWRGLSPTALESRWRDLLAADRARGFELDRPPLLRFTLVRVGEEDRRLVWSSHHLLFDGWCFPILLSEVFALYAAAVAGGTAALPPPPRPYRDYIAWLAERDEAESERYWRQALRGFIAPTPVPFDRPAAPDGADGNYAGDYYDRSVVLPPTGAAALEALARRLRVTLNILVRGAWALVLSRYAQVSDVVFGAVVSGRPAELTGVESMVGLFINSLPVRVEIPDGEAAASWLARLQASQFEQSQHAWTPLARIQALSEVPAGEPLFTSLLAFQNYPLDPSISDRSEPVGGLWIGDVALSEHTNYPLTLAAVARGDLTLRLTADRRYEPATTQRMLAQIENLLGALTADPERPPLSLPLLGAAERHQLTAEWSDTARPLPDWTVPGRFAARVAGTRDALAVVAGGESLTFATLDGRAEELARRLRAAGVATGSRVALLLDRTAEMPVALLAVWKAGGVCVPLDPASPAERLASLLADAEPAVVIHRGLRIETFLSAAPGGGPEGVLPRPEHLAYMIYTSGTTGLPKAVMVEHGSLAAVLDAFLDRFGFGPGDRMPHLARFSFDISLLELFAPLLGGGACEILDREEILDPAALMAALARATRFHAVPSLMRQVTAMARESGPERFAGLRTLFTGGDRVPPDLLAEMRQVFPAAEIVVLYGPTEATIVCTYHPVAPEARPERALIGRPFGNVEIRVVDRGEDLPPGAPGELWIGGPGVARGYFRREELTAERFVEREGRRYYRTGDLVRRLGDGTLEFLGRTDLQVKIRGFRVEPGEIEIQLAAHPGVREAVVVARAGSGAEARLVAYVVAEGAAVPAAELQAFLRDRLPEYMVPAAVVALPALPLTPNGKVDLKALSEPEPANETSAGSTPPRDAREERLAKIWRGVLGLERVGVHDNFFQLGGDSILSIQVVARARREGLLITPRQLFENQTIAGLAAVAGSVEEAGTGAEGPVEGEAPLTPIQRRFFAEERREPWRFNQAVVLTPRERLAAAPLAATLARLAGHHDALRLRFAREDGQWRQVHAPAAPVPFLEVDLMALPPAERRGALDTAMERLQSGLDLARGPLFTAALFCLGEEDRLLLTAHHLVVDGVSWRVLLEDLAAAYRGLELPAKTTSWKRWTELLAAHARSGELEEEILYWLSQQPGPPLPADLDGDGRGATASVAVELGPEETTALLKEVPQVYRTQVNDLLLAALARAFAAWTGEGALRVDLEGHGREEIFPGVDLSRTVGWFTTLFPVALTLPPGAGPREAIQEVKESLRAVPRRGLGYGLLRYMAAAETGERLAALPVPQVSFNYLGRFDPAMGEGGLFAFAPEAPRGTGGETTPGRHLFAIDALVLGDRLRINWTYDPGRHLPATAERLARGFLAEIAALIDHCRSPEAGGFTPSDFPLAGLGQAALDRVAGNDRGVEDIYPLAPMQQGMLFHSLYTAGADLYVEQLTAELVGPFDQAAFIAAWQRVVERHPALRTGFLWQEVEPPLQLVRRRAELPWTAEDWRGLPPAALESRWLGLLAADRARGFDLDRPPLLRITLVRVGGEEHRLIWSSHHLLFDGWCFPLLLSEVFALYEAAVAGREAHLPPPPRPYRDYIAWLAERDQAAAERYWRRTLAGFTAPTPAPFDHPSILGGAEGSHAADYYERTAVLPASRTAGLESLAQRLQVTLNTLVQGAWALLLSRYAQVSDVVFGAVVSGRPAELPGVESMVGLFINSLPVRVEIPQDEAASSWLARLQAGQFEQSQYAWTPLARIQAFSEVPAGEPLFTSLLAFQNYPLDSAVSGRLSELRINGVALSDHTNYPLTLSAVARGELALRLTADRRFEPATIRRMLAHLENLLSALAADPERPPRSLPLLAGAERHQLTVEWNDTATAFPAASIPALFAEQVARRPEAPALRGPGREDRLSYGELDRRAGALARELVRQGIGRGDLVGLFAERSAELVIAVLAILKTGAAYLPLDSSYPRERLALMLADGGAPLVLVQPELEARLPAGAARTLPLVPSVFDGAPWSDPTATHTATAADLAYVVYTSGSTGVPKGVAVTHRSVVRLVRDTDYADFGPDQVFLMMAPVSFDASTFELWGPLLNGGCLAILPPGEVTLDGLERAIHDAGVTTLWLTAGLFHLVVDERLVALAPLRQLLAGGDVLSPPHVARLRRELPGLRLVNGYGPTENTTFTTYHRVERVEGANVPIGRPIANTRVLVLGRDLEPAPIGVPGELYAGGAGLAVGYLGRSALTAAAFVPALFGERPGERLYRTGDLARRLPDGSLDFLGRADRQVKVRGFRIELGEIEAALADHPAVREAAVVVLRDDGRERRLVAWGIPREAMAPAPPAEAVLADLAARLPAYMVPVDLIWLDALPLSPTGKVDRDALAAMAMAVERGEAVDLTPPRGAVEETLAAIWRQVLGCERVGVHDNFFRLGGDSILSIQVVARARQAGLVVTPRQIFEEQTVAALAAVATPLAAAESEQGVVEGDVPLTPVQLYFFSARPAEPHHFNQSLLLLVPSPLAPSPLARAVAALVAHHDALRLRFVEAEGIWRAWNAPREESAPLSTLDLAALPPARRAGELEAAATALQAGFDLARGPLFRAARFVLGGGEPERLLLVAHHLVVDGVSWRILLDDLETSYGQAAAGSIVALPAKSTSWKRWAERLAGHARSAEVLGELPYWLSVSTAAAGVAPLPRDAGPGEDGTGSVATALGREATRALLGEAAAAYRTQVNDLLLAALAQTFARWTAPITGETRLRFDLEGHGREEIEPGLDLSRTVGWFTTIFPVTLAADLDAGPGEVLRAVKETLRAIPRRGLGYGLLRYLAGEEAAPLATAPDPEVAFNYLGQLDGALGASARWRPAPEPSGPEESPRARPRHAIEVNAWVLDGELRVAWSYSAARHSAAAIERLARDYAALLSGLIAHCTAAGTGGRTPSDFPLAALDQTTVDRLVGTGPSLDLTIEDLYPLAPLQQGMLFEGLRAPDSDLYFQQLIAELAGPLDTGAFARAWQAVVDRHPALRTAFAWEGLKWPLQVVRRGPRLPWTEEDWRQVPRPEVPERLAAWLAADRARAFDLARPPLMRAALLRTGEDRYRFVWSFHHLLVDGWCLSLIFREVFAFYQAAVAGRDALLPAVHPYREFIAWVARRDAAATDDFFRRELAGFTAATRLPLDRPALPAGDDGAPSDQVLRLPPALVAGLAELAQSRELTLNTLAQGAWALLLARYGGTPDVVFGTVVSGRPAELPGVESMIGLFINTLPVRLAADPAAPLDVWLAGVQERLLELRQHETAALAQVQRASEVPPGEPLFQSIVAFENFPVDESLGEGAEEIAVSEVTVTGPTDYPLSFAVIPGRRGSHELSLSLSHDRRTDTTTARRLLIHLERLLGAFVTAPQCPLSELPTLSAAERHQLVLEWNDTVLEAAETAEDLCLHDLMSVQARRLPTAVALSGEGREMTYAELDRRTNQLANHLGALGVGPESRVAIMVERSLEMVVAVLGILKAGGAYVPIDPATPADRLDFLLADARPALLLAGAGLADRLREAAVAVVALDAERERIAAASAEPPAIKVDPENLAYVIYTSGSTGTPKGVAVRHRSAAAYARAVAREYGMRAGDRELQFASLSFDASVEEIFAPLAAGATVVPRSGPAEEPARFLAGCAELGITVLSLPTAYWHQIAAAVETGDPPLPPALRLIVMGGERALPERWAAWGRGPGRRVRLVNAYGPTEATIAATLHEHPGTPEPLAGRREVPIGRPLAGVRAQVVDPDLRPVPAGGIGELLLGGVGVARGYLGRPGLTAERFVPDPLSGEPGARLYRTGDLVQLLPGGTLEFAGRLDDQVKVRGFRIEPGEIEAVLATHPGLREAAVVVYRGDSLLACVVPADPAAPPPIAELRAFLAERLPAHMVPTAYAVLPALPLTSSDKVDRRALARQEHVTEPAGERVAPATPLEELLAGAAAEVLGVGVERVGMRDNFFDLGGHSLLATQLVSQLSQGHGIQVTLQMVFDASDLGELADRIVEAELARVDSGLLDEALREMEGMSPEELQDLLGGADGLEEDA
jgi:amino acid adenylation domain-containing protein/non-ribosomal peptide synthase protein (TIGR01720 family)